MLFLGHKEQSQMLSHIRQSTVCKVKNHQAKPLGSEASTVSGLGAEGLISQVRSPRKRKHAAQTSATMAQTASVLIFHSYILAIIKVYILIYCHNHVVQGWLSMLICVCIHIAHCAPVLDSRVMCSCILRCLGIWRGLLWLPTYCIFNLAFVLFCFWLYCREKKNKQNKTE